MNEVQSNLRVRLGPIATALIEGRTDNRQQALDDAIQSLIERADSAPQPGSEAPALAAKIEALEAASHRNAGALADAIAELKSEMIAQAQMLAAFRHKVLVEMQTTRLFVTSLIEDHVGEGQEEVLEIGRQMIEEVREIPGLLSDDEKLMLQKEERIDLEVLRRDMERGREEPETQPTQMQRWHEPEMER